MSVVLSSARALSCKALCRSVRAASKIKSVLMVPNAASVSIRRSVTSDTVREERAVSRFPVPDISSLPDDIRERIMEVEEKSGFIPNVFKALAYRPDEFRAFFAFYDALMEKESDTLTKAEKEMIVVATSAHNDCLYCVVAHSALHRIFSKDRLKADQIAVNWKLADLTARERAILSLAMDLCQSKHVSDAQLKDLELHGLTREDVWDVGAITAFFALSNRMAHLTSMLPNNEFYLIGRVSREKSA